MKKSLENFIRKFVRDYPKQENTVSRWKDPLIGYASVTDEKFLANENEKIQKLRTILPSAHTIISFFIPFSEEITDSNITGNYASRQWVFANIETNRLVHKLSNAIKNRLEAKGYESKTLTDGEVADRLSDTTFSVQYIGYVAGLGTFGLNKALITKNGCAGLFGAVITELKIQPSEKLAEEYCFGKKDESCNDCISSCPVSAISTSDIDSHSCSDFLMKNNEIYSSLGDCRVCGKCISNVRCSKSAG